MPVAQECQALPDVGLGGVAVSGAWTVDVIDLQPEVGYACDGGPFSGVVGADDGNHIVSRTARIIAFRIRQP